MAVSKLVLGLNARSFLYLKKYNKKTGKRIADDKLETKQMLLEHDIPTTKLLALIRSYGDIREFDWSSLKGDFVLKPARGFGGEGILVVFKWDGTSGVDSDGEEIAIHDLESRIFNILDGAHSRDGLPDTAFLEDRVIVSNGFRKISAGGIPDIRVIVCNRVPVMAMLRLPTKESGGKANIHMGALAIGIDLRTGITTRGMLRNREVVYIPGSKTKVHGIKIPKWNKILSIATRAQEVSGLGFAGIDIVLDERHGPLILETNARPGLGIQLANGESLRTRLERVAEIDIPTVAKGIDLAKELFAEPVLSDVPSENNVLHVVEKIHILGKNNKRKTVLAKIDTGAYRTAIDISLVHELGLELHDELVYVKAGVGSEERNTTKVTFRLRGKEIKTVATYLNRDHMRFQVIVGRRDLQGFLVDPGAVHEHVQ